MSPLCTLENHPGQYLLYITTSTSSRDHVHSLRFAQSHQISKDTMAPAKAVLTTKAPAPIPQLSQAVVYNGMVYCSGSLGIDPATGKMVEGTVKDRTVWHY